MGKTFNHDEDLHPTDLEPAHLVLVSTLARTVASLSSSDCWRVLRMFDATSDIRIQWSDVENWSL